MLLVGEDRYTGPTLPAELRPYMRGDAARCTVGIPLSIITWR